MNTFLGTGLLGSNFTKAWLKKGEKVQVWNRTAEKAKALEEDGAEALDTPAEAVKGANYIHLALKDDAAVDEVLAKAEPGMEKGVYIIDHTTTSVKGAQKRTKEWKEKGFIYQHAPVLMGPKNARESTGFMLVSGEQDVIQHLLPHLEKMTGKVYNFGDHVGKAAGMKLIANLYLITYVGGIADMVSLAKTEGITHDDLSMLLEKWNPGVTAQHRVDKMKNAHYDNPSWMLSMARKDAGLMMQEADRHGIELVALPAVAAQMDRLIKEGLGSMDWSIIGKEPVVKKS